jgi:hypothetical protein
MERNDRSRQERIRNQDQPDDPDLDVTRRPEDRDLPPHAEREAPRGQESMEEERQVD